MQQKNLFLAFVLSALIMVGWVALSQYLGWVPQPKPKSTELAKTDAKNKPQAEESKKSDAKEKKTDDKKPEEKKSLKEAERLAAADLQQLPVTPSDKLVRLGAKQRDSRFHLFVELDPRGAGVRSLWLNKYQAADSDGQPVWSDAEKKEPTPLELIPAELNEQNPSFQLFAFDVNDVSDDQPLDTLGRINWTVVPHEPEEVAGRRRESVSFQAETQGVILTKTYSLTEGEYHLALEVKMRRKEGSDKNIAFRYQMTGAHGLPVEGKWYTSTFRNALIALADRNGVIRDLQDLRQISNWGGGNLVPRESSNTFLYAGVANQYFASMIVVDNQQKNRAFLRQARPTLETALTKGTVVRIAEDGTQFVLKPFGSESEQTFYTSQKGSRRLLLGHLEGRRIAVLHHTASALERNGEYPEIVTEILSENALPAVWVDDITVRVSSEPVELKDDTEVVHKYLLYNGPVKVNQLFPPPGLPSKPLEQGGVPPELYQRYHEELRLDTLTDYHSPGAMGTFASKIYWTELVIKCTNLMHAVLGYIHVLIPSYGLCIIVLTVLVRGLMFPLSRKQALMSARMQQLAPELKKLQEKYKDDRQALGMAQMELYRKHGVNPFGTCWVLLLQMPIFMGLYFALQESTHFRLAPFWPTWITNLAAPDKLFYWGRYIPWISRDEDYGSLLYLGPYFNLLPVIAVALMIIQQKLMTPPPADEQQAVQQKMMTYMMVFIGLMFYKVAAGLCLYFIASSAWGFCERKLLPKRKPEAGEPTVPIGESYFQKLLRHAYKEQAAASASSAISLETSVRPASKRRRDRRRLAAARAADSAVDKNSTLGRGRKRFHEWWVRLREWWFAVLKEAEKKHRS